jgi:hypothetical protein
MISTNILFNSATMLHLRYSRQNEDLPVKHQNLLFSLFFSCILAAPFALFFLQKIDGTELPKELTAAEASYLEGGAYSSEPLLIQDFATGKFQASFEQRINQYIPFKASAMLGNAALQREYIQLSSSLFQFECFPTYFGSDALYLTKDNALMRFPETNSDILQTTKDFAQSLGEIANELPSVNFIIYLADISNLSSSNPARTLVSDTSPTTDDCASILQSELRNAKNVTVLSQSPENTNAYFDHYYRTDHHWSGYGTLAAYEQIAGAASLRHDVASIVSNPTLHGLVMNGSNARSGLMLLDEIVREPVFLCSNLATKNTAPPPVDQNSGRAALDSDPLHTEFDFYHSWYGPSSPITIDNFSQTPVNNKRALLIGDSYTSSMQWLIAQNYETTLVRLDCHGAYAGPDKFIDLIANNEYPDVYFVMAPTGMEYLKNCYPQYFSDQQPWIA